MYTVNIFKLTDQLVSYRHELEHRLQQCFDNNHPYNVTELNNKLELVDRLIGELKCEILEIL